MMSVYTGVWWLTTYTMYNHGFLVWIFYLSNVFCPVAFVHVQEEFSSGQCDIKSSSPSFIIIAVNELGNKNVEKEDTHDEEQQPVDDDTQPAA